MRLGVLDVGSNTVHLLVVDAHVGGPPVPFASHKEELRLAELMEPDGSLSQLGADRLVKACSNAALTAADARTEDLVAFATSAVREATNSAEVLARVQNETGVDLQVLPGPDEARLTFHAVRRWFGWSAGRLINLDIGGGSLEIAAGTEEEPTDAVSVPLGAGRLSRAFLTSDPPSHEELMALRTAVRETLAPVVADLSGPFDHAAATSKTFKQLARIAGAAPSSAGLYVERGLRTSGATAVRRRVSKMTVAERVQLEGVSIGRAPQLVAGAVVAEETLLALGLTGVQICPWALREGVILQRLDWLSS